jgi:endonuclease/exonuclease/phosphatase family metal-dependent hydrolase
MNSLRNGRPIARAAFAGGVVFATALCLVGTAGSPAHASVAPGSGGALVTVMTRNMDAGTDFGPVLAATSPLAFVQATTATWQEVLASNIPERAAGIAREITRNGPEFVNLQEVSQWYSGSPGSPAATNLVLDALKSLQDALAADGAHYTAVVVTTNSALEAPTLLGYDVATVDHDVILARTDLPPNVLSWSNVRSAAFATQLTIPTIVGPVTVTRGWASLDANLHGHPVRIIDTHLEQDAFPAVQLAQAQELLAGPANTTMPVVLASDLNTGPGVTPTYDAMLAAGMTDTWTATRPANPGQTWPLHGEDPATSSATPFERIDLALTRGGIRPLVDLLVGASPAALTPSGLWPSDHAGVLGILWVPGPAATRS